MSNQVYVFGEVLFDRFEDGSSVLGGAPFNVAWHLQALGLSPTMISRVGDDEAGRSVLVSMNAWGLDTAYVSVDKQRPTGAVSVRLQQGEPSYCIEDNQAYDAIPCPKSSNCRWLYHGSLALRHAPNRMTLDHLRQQSGALVFVDINLRAPWWTQSLIDDCVGHADYLKLNRDELDLLEPGDEMDLQRRMLALQRRYQLKGLIVTLAEQGACGLFGREYAMVRPEAALTVIDTVGAGDAFAAVALLGLIEGWSLQTILQCAQQFASLMVAQRGAICADRSLYQTLLSNWSDTGCGVGQRVG